MAVVPFFTTFNPSLKADGTINSLGTVTFYEPNTVTGKAVYAEAALSTSLGSAVTLLSDGRKVIFLNGNYDCVIKNSSGETIATLEDINPMDTGTVSAISSNTTLDFTHNGKFLEVSGTTTITLTDASTLNAGWNVDIRNTGTSTNVTIARGTSGDTINGQAANLTLYPGEAIRIWVSSPETGFYTLGPINNEVLSTAHTEQSFVRNLSLTASTASSALTLALKGANGSDPSTSNPVTVAFRNSTATSGDYSNLRITTATSFTASAGSTFGMTSGQAARLWAVLFNDGGTARMGLVNCSTSTHIYPLADDMLASSTAEGGAGAADSAGVIYTGTAVTSKPMRVLGYIEITEATAGTWDTEDTKIQLWTPGMKLPGDIVQLAMTQTGAVATGTTQIPIDDTIPQNTEGDQYLSVAITPTSAINKLRIDTYLAMSTSAATSPTVALFQDTTANALAAVNFRVDTATASEPVSFSHFMGAGTTSATTFKVRVGPSTAVTVTVNGASGGRLLGGVMASSMHVIELMG